MVSTAMMGYVPQLTEPSRVPSYALSAHHGARIRPPQRVRGPQHPALHPGHDPCGGQGSPWPCPQGRDVPGHGQPTTSAAQTEAGDVVVLHVHGAALLQGVLLEVLLHGLHFLREGHSIQNHSSPKLGGKEEWEGKESQPQRTAHSHF